MQKLRAIWLLLRHPKAIVIGITDTAWKSEVVGEVSIGVGRSVMNGYLSELEEQASDHRAELEIEEQIKQALGK